MYYYIILILYIKISIIKFFDAFYKDNMYNQKRRNIRGNLKKLIKVIMPTPKTCYTVVIASPSDVDQERLVAEEAINIVNNTFKDSNVFLEPRRWETDAHLNFHPEGPQGVIDEALRIEESEIFIGIFYLKFGTPTKKTDSGTIHEINQAIKAFNEKGSPEIKLYFKKPINQDLDKLNKDEFEEIEKIKEFKKEMFPRGIIGEFEEKEEFEKMLIQEFTHFLLRKTGVISTKLKRMTKENIEVENIIEFIKAIGSNRKIILKSGKYELSNLEDLRRKPVYHERVFDGQEIIIQGVENLTIESQGHKSELLIAPSYANVINFRDCSNITLSNLIFGHYPKKGSCEGGVISIKNCNNININDSILFGSGTLGLILSNVNTLIFESSIIKECTYGIMEISDSKNIYFRRSVFTNNQIIFYGIVVSDFSMVEFNECHFIENFSMESNMKDMDQLFVTSINSDIVVKRSIIKNNSLGNLIRNKQYISFEDTIIENNKFGEIT